MAGVYRRTGTCLAVAHYRGNDLPSHDLRWNYQGLSALGQALDDGREPLLQRTFKIFPVDETFHASRDEVCIM